jgi:hypothetical protein
LTASRTRSELLVQRQEEALDLFGKRQVSQKRKCLPRREAISVTVSLAASKF